VDSISNDKKKEKHQEQQCNDKQMSTNIDK